MPDKAISHQPERRRYELRLDDRVVGIADYTEEEGVRSFTHTVIEPRHRGQGLAAELVGFALADARASDLRVLPLCWYVRDHIAQHQEFLELVPAGQRGSFGLPGDD